ncbi:MAG: hypothetical protein IJ659_00865 [Alloprevotella sp.]|nr:hypothetical protein [Alloprevotella sp.]
MKLRVKIEKIEPLVQGTSKQGYAYARREVALSFEEQTREQARRRHTLICSTSGDFARLFEERVKPGIVADAELDFIVETFNFRSYQRVLLRSVDVEGARQLPENRSLFDGSEQS